MAWCSVISSGWQTALCTFDGGPSMRLNNLKGGHWTITGLPLNQLDRLEGIPGLKVTSNGEVTGSLDGCSVALNRLNIHSTLATPPDWKKRSGADHTLTKLRQYQRQGVEHLVECLNKHGAALLADDMGLGKTLQTITTVQQLTNSKDRILVAAPRAAAETWREELKKWVPDESVAVLNSIKTKADKADWERAKTARWVVSSYDMVMMGKLDLVFEGTFPAFVVLDEAHRLKGRKAKRAKALKEVCTTAQYRLALTGTPVWDRSRDLWMLLHILFGYRFGNQWDFDRVYCGGKINEHGGWENSGAANTDELKLRLAHYMLRREKREVATELPPLTRIVRWVDSTPKASAAFQKLELKLDGGSLHSALEATLQGKLDEAINLAAECRNFLLFTWMKRHAFDLHKQLNDGGTPCHLITGDIDTRERQNRINLARERKEGIVATIDAASESINMQGIASTGIIHAIDWVPTKMAQAEARLHRIGQTEPVTWYYLAMKDSADQLVVHSVVNKLDTFISIMGAKDIQGMRNELNSHGNGAGADEMALLREMAALLSDGDVSDD